MKKITLLFCLSFVILLSACKTNKTALNLKSTTYLNIDTLSSSYIQMTKLIEPYKTNLDKEMKAVLGKVEKDLNKAKPEGTLCNFVADAVLSTARNKYKGNIDFCIVNFGGIRINMIPEGNITKGKVYELMPFDNTLSVVEVDGNSLAKIFDKIASDGGWPVSKEIKMYIVDSSKVDKLYINNELLNYDKQYSVLMSDYLANGGDKLGFLKDVKRYDMPLLFRDAILEYIDNETKKGHTLDANIEGRILFHKK